VAQVDHLVDPATEEVGAVGHRKTPRNQRAENQNLGEMLSDNSPKVVSDQ
jgi:hypothetical protein